MFNQMFSIYFDFIQKISITLEKENCCACPATQDIFLHDKLYKSDFYRAVVNTGSTLCYR